MGLRYYHRTGRGRGYSNGPFLEMLQANWFWATIGVLFVVGLVTGLVNGDHNSQQTALGFLGWGAIIAVVIVAWRWLKRTTGLGQPTAAVVPSKTPAAATTKTCPDCAETVLAPAKVCKHCGYRFDG